MSANLKKLQEFVDKMKSTSSLLEKKTIIETIKNDDFITNALYYTYNLFLKFNVTSKNCRKLNHIIDEECGFVDIFELFDDLNNRTYTGHDAIAMVNGVISQNEQYADLIFSIIDRNLEIRASESVINKVIPGLIPTFDVALATKYEPKFCDFNNQEWLASRKLDGVRCIIRKEHEYINALHEQLLFDKNSTMWTF